MTFQADYTMGRMIGQGGFAKVFNCTQNATGTPWAVKVTYKALVLPHDVVHARQEMDLLRTLSHPCIVTVADAYESNTNLWLVMECVEGGQLFNKIVEMDAYPEHLAARLMRNLLSGVEYLHSCGIAHRDLKPENLLLVGQGTPDEQLTTIKIADFGLARPFEPGVPSFTDTDGSLPYLSPEIVNLMSGGPRVPYDEKCDLWAVGVICFVLLSGCFPFMGNSTFETRGYIRQANYSFGGKSWTSISEEAKDFIKNLLTLDPASRPSASDALRHPWIAEPVTEPAGPPAEAHLLETADESPLVSARGGVAARDKLKGVVYVAVAVGRLHRLSKLARRTAASRASWTSARQCARGLGPAGPLGPQAHPLELLAG
eukprot:EG_transcript_11970